jgi:hypothetical protein
MIEVWTEDCPLTFDGLVLELFSPTPVRWHVAMLTEVRLEEGRQGALRLRIDAQRAGGVSGYLVPAANVAGFRALVAAIDQVRRDRYRLGPVRSS